MDSFDKAEFWYADQRKQSFSETKKPSFKRNEDKWWLPEPCVPESGLSDALHRELQHKRDQASQIHKMAMEINNAILSEMQIPSSYIETLPKVYMHTWPRISSIYRDQVDLHVASLSKK